MPEQVRSGNGSITTSSTPGDYTLLPSQECRRVTVYNLSGEQVLLQQDGGGVAIPLNSGNAYPWAGIENADQIGITSNDPSLEIFYRWEL